VLNKLITMPWRHGGNGGMAPPCLISALSGDEWSHLSQAILPSWEKSPLCILDERLGGPQSRSGRCQEKTPAVQALARRCTDWAIPARIDWVGSLYFLMLSDHVHLVIYDILMDDTGIWCCTCECCKKQRKVIFFHDVGKPLQGDQARPKQVGLCNVLN
jgi:hypothetical protein